MTEVIWSPQAIRDVESIRAFIAQDSRPTLTLKPGASLPQSSASSPFPNRAVPSLSARQIVALFVFFFGVALCMWRAPLGDRRHLIVRRTLCGESWRRSLSAGSGLPIHATATSR